MRFTEEDGIISASQAQRRSLEGTEDSIVRESIREAMESIKRSSFYGYRETVLMHRREMPHASVNELELLGYKITQRESPSQEESVSKRLWYDIVISW